MDRGMGRGGGRGLGRGRGAGRSDDIGPFGRPPAAERFGEGVGLRAEARNLEAQLQEINARIARGTSERPLVAVVNVDACAGCGVCTKVCPEGAIAVNGVAIIDATRCTGCGRCVAECPRDAVTLWAR